MPKPHKLLFVQQWRPCCRSGGVLLFHRLLQLLNVHNTGLDELASFDRTDTPHLQSSRNRSRWDHKQQSRCNTSL